MMSYTMMQNIFPAATIMTLATTNANIPPSDLTGAIFQFGVPTVLLAALGWFTFWQEKQRIKRDEIQREFTNSVIEVLREENKELREALYEKLKNK